MEQMEQNRQAIRRVLIVQSGSLFDEGLESMLTQQTDFQVIGVHYSDDARFLLTMQREHPDVILLFEDSPLEARRVFDLLEAAPLRVITVRSGGNCLEMYERQAITAAQSQDLFALIRQ
jgi:DNA-binding NarL/FixJ family response regulator